MKLINCFFVFGSHGIAITPIGLLQASSQPEPWFETASAVLFGSSPEVPFSASIPESAIAFLI